MTTSVASVSGSVVAVLNKGTGSERFSTQDFKDAQGTVLGTQIVDSGSTALVVADAKGESVRIRVGSAGKFKRGKPYVATEATVDEVAVKIGARLATETGDTAFAGLVAELATREAAQAAAAKAARAAAKAAAAPVVAPTPSTEPLAAAEIAPAATGDVTVVEPVTA